MQAILKQFKNFDPLPKLLQDGGACVATLKNLPKTHQLALVHYMSVDGAAWAVDHEAFPDWKWGEGTRPEYRKQVLADCQKFLPRFIKHFGHEQFGYATVPTQALLDTMRKYNPMAVPHKFVFDGAYKRPTWPCILHGSEEIIQDGWHRFFNRLTLNIKNCPVVWYV